MLIYMEGLTKKQIAKKLYNESYKVKVHAQEAQEAKTEVKAEVKTEAKDIRKIINEELNFFLKNNKTTETQSPQPLIIQTQPVNLKMKMLETLAISSLGLIPLILKHIFQKSNNLPIEPSQKPAESSSRVSTDMSCFS